jgi:hypothetical protein
LTLVIAKLGLIHNTLQIPGSVSNPRKSGGTGATVVSIAIAFVTAVGVTAVIVAILAVAVALNVPLRCHDARNATTRDAAGLRDFAQRQRRPTEDEPNAGRCGRGVAIGKCECELLSHQRCFFFAAAEDESRECWPRPPSAARNLTAKAALCDRFRCRIKRPAWFSGARASSESSKTGMMARSITAAEEANEEGNVGSLIAFQD